MRSVLIYLPVLGCLAMMLVVCGPMILRRTKGNRAVHDSSKFTSSSEEIAQLRALIMGVFVLGTSPLFAALGYGLRRAGASFGSNIARIAGAVVLVMAVITVNGGLTLAGSPVSLNAIQRDNSADTQKQNDEVGFPAGGVKESPAPSSTGGAGIQTLMVNVENTGYFPGSVKARAGVPTKLGSTDVRHKRLHAGACDPTPRHPEISARYRHYRDCAREPSQGQAGIYLQYGNVFG